MNIPSNSTPDTMQRFEDKDAMRAWSRRQRADGARVAFVPTMGYLHEGHLSLVREAASQCDRVVVSIYVNPTQFAPDEDFDVYPRDMEGDLAKLRALNVDAVFLPRNLYGSKEHPQGSRTWVDVMDLTATLCGESRPHFFRGVTTVVTKLLHIVEPDVAIFGQKDYQQWRVIDAMVRDLDMPVEIVRMPIKREPDGLAMSSRNARLSSAARAAATALPKTMALAASKIAETDTPIAEILNDAKAALEAAGAITDYLSLVDGETLVPIHNRCRVMVLAAAVSFDDVRLIDNVEVRRAS